MAWSLVQLLCFCVLVLVSSVEAKVETKYTDLREAVVPTGISLEFQQKGFERQLYPITCTDKASCVCALSDTGCQTPIFNFDEDTMMHVSFSVPEDVGQQVISANGEETYDAPTKVTIKACYAKPSTAKRKWRKIKNIIDDDKRCSKKIVKGFDLVPGQTEYTIDYELPSDSPEAQWFFTLYFLCPIKGDSDTNYCGLDTTVGSLGELMAPEDLAGTVDEKDAVLGQARSNQLYYQTEVMDSRPSEMVAGVIALSIVAIVLLVSYFTYERFLKKQA